MELPDGTDASAPVTQVVRAVVAVQPAVPVFIHHTGAAALDVPVAATVHRVRTLTGALHEVLATVRLHPPST